MIGQKSFFRGGIELRDDRQKTLDEPIRNATLPNIALVPFLQHSGAPARPVVKKGDRVQEGMLIGAADGDGASVHAPIPGVVSEIRDFKTAEGRDCKAAVIELSGSFERTGRESPIFPWENSSPEELIDLIRDMGVVGLGFSFVPTHIKLHKALSNPLTHLVINAMESEPFSSSDYRIMIERFDAVIEGCRILEHITKAATVVLGINADYHDAISVFRKNALRVSPPLKVQALSPVYPQGDELLLIETLLNRSLPRGVDTISSGVMVMNVSTVLAVYEAVALRLPLIERVITVAGDAVRKPQNIKARIGTPISLILEECGGLRFIPDRIVLGGPMLGRSVRDLDTPLTKQTSLVLAMGHKEIAYAPERSCVHCGNCVRNCPVGLEPIRLARLIQHGRLEDAHAEGLMDCSECGICSYACPSRIPLVDILRSGKAKIREASAQPR